MLKASGFEVAYGVAAERQLAADVNLPIFYERA